MKNTKKITALILALLIAFSVTACAAPKKSYDISAYIEGVLSDSYKGTTIAGAENYGQTTAENAAVRFLNKYQMNADETQRNDLIEVFKTAYNSSKFTVRDETKATYGFDVVVDYDVQTTFKDIENDIQKRYDEAAKMGLATQEGAEYITGIIELCKNSVAAPTFDGTGTLTFDIKVDEESNLSLNIKLFDKLDESILPLE